MHATPLLYRYTRNDINGRTIKIVKSISSHNVVIHQFLKLNSKLEQLQGFTKDRLP